MSSTVCPSVNELRKYLTDELKDGTSQAIEDHVEHCVPCETTIRNILDASVFLGNECESEADDLQHPPDLPHYVSSPDPMLGSGGFGVVWKMKDTRLNRDVAVKVMRFRDSKKPALVRRFLAEAQICSQLAHPFIVPVYEMGKLADGRGYFVMKLVVGKRLNECFPETTTQWTSQIRTFETVCQAVAYAHEKDVVHRDLKPQNVMVGEHGEVQVMDWGLAKAGVENDVGPSNDSPRPVMATTRIESDQTAASAIGTFAYMSPEQAKNASSIDARSDVFSLGAILCELLTGQPPYVANENRTVANLASNARLEDAYQRLDSCNADPRIIKIARQCLSETVSDRPVNGKEVANSIQQFLGSIEEELQQERIASERQRVQFEEEAKRRSIRNRVAMAVGLLAMIGMFAAWNYFSQRAERFNLLKTDSATAMQNAEQFIEQNQLADARNELLKVSNRIDTLSVKDSFPDVETMLADINLALDLVAARKTMTYNGIGFNNGEVIDHYLAAFKKRGWDATDMDKDSIQALVNSATLEQIYPHLDFMVGTALHRIVQLEDKEEKQRVDQLVDHWLSVARQVDPKQQSYPLLRDRQIWHNPDKLVEAVRDGQQAVWHWSLYDLMFDLLVREKSDADGVGLEDLEGDFKSEVLELAEQLRRNAQQYYVCLLYTSPSPRDRTRSRMPSSA